MKNSSRVGKLLALLATLALFASACGSDETATGGDGPVTVCELAYYTGDFGDLGSTLTNDIAFPINEVINEDPPLGREWTLVSEDLGTVGEAQAARACIETHEAEVIVSIAHGYREYRDYMLEIWEENDSPIVPSVHGGAIPGNIGGQASEPIFRAQGLDAGLGTSGILYAEDQGFGNVVIMETEVEGFLLASDAAAGAADFVGIDVLERITSQPSQPSYRSEIETIAALSPDAVILQANSVDSATIIKQAAEAGVSLNWIGETGLFEPEFIDTLGAENLASQASVGIAAFSADQSSDAWATYASLWDATEANAEFGEADNSYHYSTYDVMVQTALAVEAAGSYLASDWSAAMRDVGSAPGTECSDYATCLALIRDGEDIDYNGVTGSGDYTEGGVNDVAAAYTPFNTDGSLGDAVFLDSARQLEIVDAVAPVATCDDDNVCDW